MKRLLTILCLFLSSTLWAAEPVQLSRLGVMMMGGGATAAATYCAGTELFCFEDATTWDAANAESADCTYDADGDWCDGDTTTYKFGAKSVGVMGSADYYVAKNLGTADQGEFYVEGWFRWDSRAAWAVSLYLRDSGLNNVLKIAMSDGYTLRVLVKDDTVAVDTSPAYTIASATWYHIGVYFKLETGSNDGIIRIWANESATAGFSVTDIKVSSTTVDTGSVLADQVRLGGAASGQLAYYDNVKVVAGAPSWTYE